MGRDTEKPKRRRLSELTPEEREYREFRTGFTWREVRDMLWYQDQFHPAHHTRRRHSVLGKWREIKLEMWRHYQSQKALAEAESEVPFWPTSKP